MGLRIEPPRSETGWPTGRDAVETPTRPQEIGEFALAVSSGRRHLPRFDGIAIVCFVWGLAFWLGFGGGFLRVVRLRFRGLRRFGKAG